MKTVRKKYSKQFKLEAVSMFEDGERPMAEIEREPTIRINDLDIALVLLTKISELYSRLDEKQR